MNIKLSIIVPVYKVEKYLRRCIDSILGQTLKEIEIILIDDCSPDSSPAICDEYANKYENVRVIHKAHNEGLGMACNTGIENAQGDFVAFCDSDDWVEPEMYTEMLDAAYMYKADAVYTGLKRVDNDGNVLGYMYHPASLQVYETKEEINKFVLDMIATMPSERAIRKIQVSAKVVLYKKEIIDKNNLRFISERIIPSEDQCFNLSFLVHCESACVLPKFYYNYRINQNSITLSIREDLFDKTKLLYDYTVKLCEENHIEGALLRINRMMIDYTRNFLVNVCQSNLTKTHKKEILIKTCKDQIWEKIWEEYPITSMWWKHRIFAYALKQSYTSIVYLLAII